MFRRLLFWFSSSSEGSTGFFSAQIVLYFLFLIKQDFMAGTTQKGRCDTVFNLMKRGCQSDLVENPTVHVTIPSDRETNTQVTPGKVSVQLRPGWVVSNTLILS